jgi:drug/metabolite transporter (DMT)-like permease
MKSFMKNYLNFILFLLLALLWSGSFINIKIVVGAFPPVFSALIRVFIAFLCLTLFFLSRHKTILIPFKDAWRLWITGFFGQALPFALLFYGERFVAPATASILNSTVSIWALLLGTLLFRDVAQWTANKIIGLLLGLIGIIFIFFPAFIHADSKVIGMISVLGMAISYAIGALLNQHLVFGKMKTTIEINLWQQHISSLFCLSFISLILEPWPSFSELFNIKILGAFLYLGLFATAIAWIIYFHLLKSWDAVRASSVMYIVPVLAILWDYMFLHIIPSWNRSVGALTILLGVLLIQWTREKFPPLKKRD